MKIKTARKTILVTLPDGSKVKVRRSVKVIPASALTDLNNRTFAPVSKAKRESPGGVNRDFGLGYAGSYAKVVKRGRVFGLKGGRR